MIFNVLNILLKHGKNRINDFYNRLSFGKNHEKGKIHFFLIIVFHDKPQ